MTRKPWEVQLGQLLLDEGLVTKEQLDGALAVQASVPDYVPLGRILVERKAITDRQLSLVVERRGDRRLRLGELLVRSGAITEARLQQALAQQQRVQRPLGEILIKMGAVTDEVMRQALGTQLNIPFVDLDRIEPDPRLSRLINSNYARRHVLVPIAQTGQMLTVCMDDPTSTSVVDELAASTGYVVNIVTAAREAIGRAFQRLYDQAIDTPLATQASDLADAFEAAGGDGIDLGEGAVKSEFIADYVQGKSADGAVRQLLALALNRHCSDIHLEMLASGMHVRFRMDGILQELELGALQEMCDHGGAQVISRIKVLAKLDIAERRRPQDGAFRARIERKGEQEYIDFRVSIVPGYYGESCVLRVLDKKNAPTSIEKLGFSPAITTSLNQLLKRPAGILLVAGPTGSGKSTTLYASLMATYRPEIRVLTAEDPIEYVYDQLSQSEVNERIGNTFARYLRAFLRHDPEVIMIGEIRDEETAEMAFRAAQTGHLLLSTLHTNDAISAVTRLLDLNVDPNLLASSLLGVLAQRLIRRVCPDCRQEYEPVPELVREFFPTRPEGLTFYQGAGCRTCNFTGYRGRTCIAELWVPDAEDVILISKKAPFDEVRASARRTTISMAQDVMDRLAVGRTTLEELIRVMPYASVYQFRQLAAAGLLSVTPVAAPATEAGQAGPATVAAAEPEPPAEAAEAETESRLLAFEPTPEQANDEGIQIVEEVDAAEPAADSTPASDGKPAAACNDRTSAALRRLDQARSLTEILNVLADHAAAETGRVALLTVASSRLRTWALRGLPAADSAAIDVPIVPNTIFDLAVRQGRSVTTVEAPVGFGSDPLSNLLTAAAGRTGLALPIAVGGRTVAILFTDQAGALGPQGGGAWREQVEILVRHAGQCLEVLTKSASTSADRYVRPDRPPAAADS